MGFASQPRSPAKACIMYAAPSSPIPDPRSGNARLAGAGAGTPTKTMPAELLFFVDNSVAVVAARADGVNVPSPVVRYVILIVADAPAARLPTVHTLVVELNWAGTEADTKRRPPKLSVAVDAVAAAEPRFRSV